MLLRTLRRCASTSIVRLGTEDPRMSKIVVHRGVVYTSGQTDTSGSTVEEQTLACLAKVDDLLAQAGTDKSRTCARAPPLRAAAAAATRA